jgi:nucleoprotein TPR
VPATNPPAAAAAPASDEDLIALQNQLRALEAERDELLAKLSVIEHANTIEEGETSVEEQILAQVEAIRAELNARYEQRVKLEEERFRTRADKMKAALNKQLSTLKASNVEKVDHDINEIEAHWRKTHEAELQSLKERHAEELAELQRQIPQSAENSTIKQQPPQNDPSAGGKWEPTEAQIKELLTTNTLARKFVINSINNRERKVREEEQAKLAEEIAKEVAKAREEENQKLAAEMKEVDTKIARAKQDAEAMVDKRYTVKFTMTENRLRAATFKVEQVTKAATETPEEPIGKVWTAIKDLKPPAKPAQATNSTPAKSPGVQTGLAQITNGTPSVTQTPEVRNTNGAKANPVAPQSSPFSTQPNTGLQAPQSKPFSVQPGNATQPAPSLIAAPPGGTVQAKPSPISTQTSTGTQPIPSTTSAQPTTITTAQPTQPQPSQLPKQIPSLGQSSHAPAGRGHSGLPVARGNRGRGTGIPRGGGRGGYNRGGLMQSVNATIASNAQPEAGAKGMNPGAQQFVPGQKRGLDASEYAGDEKRRKSGEE